MVKILAKGKERGAFGLDQITAMYLTLDVCRLAFNLFLALGGAKGGRKEGRKEGKKERKKERRKKKKKKKKKRDAKKNANLFYTRTRDEQQWQVVTSKVPRLVKVETRSWTSPANRSLFSIAHHITTQRVPATMLTKPKDDLSVDNDTFDDCLVTTIKSSHKLWRVSERCRNELRRFSTLPRMYAS